MPVKINIITSAGDVDGPLKVLLSEDNACCSGRGLRVLVPLALQPHCWRDEVPLFIYSTLKTHSMLSSVVGSQCHGSCSSLIICLGTGSKVSITSWYENLSFGFCPSKSNRWDNFGMVSPLFLNTSSQKQLFHSPLGEKQHFPHVSPKQKGFPPEERYSNFYSTSYQSKANTSTQRESAFFLSHFCLIK